MNLDRFRLLVPPVEILVMALLLFAWVTWLRPSTTPHGQEQVGPLRSSSDEVCKVRKFDSEPGPRYRCFDHFSPVPCPRAILKVRWCGGEERADEVAE